MNEALYNMIKGLTLHFLHQGTVDQAIKQGRQAGIPAELLESLPGMMYVITSSACAIWKGNRTLDDVADEITESALTSGNAEDFSRADTVRLLEITLEFIQDISKERGEEKPLPEMTQPWYAYQPKEI